MIDLSGMGKMILLLGFLLVVVGAVLMLIGKWPGAGSSFGWLGRLPGDIFIKSEIILVFYFSHYHQHPCEYCGKPHPICVLKALERHEAICSLHLPSFPPHLLFRIFDPQVLPPKVFGCHWPMRQPKYRLMPTKKYVCIVPFIGVSA